MVLITVASSQEARPFLKKYFGKGYLPNDYLLEVDNGKFLVITGRGQRNVGRCWKKLNLDVSCISYIINISIAGSLDPSLGIGEILRVDRICSRGETIGFKPYFNDFLKGLNSVELETRRLPVLWGKKKAGQIVDMEAGALAKCCCNIPLAFVKVVTDYCSLTSFIASVLFHRSVIQKGLLRAFEGVI